MYLTLVNHLACMYLPACTSFCGRQGSSLPSCGQSKLVQPADSNSRLREIILTAANVKYPYGGR